MLCSSPGPRAEDADGTRGQLLGEDGKLPGVPRACSGSTPPAALRDGAGSACGFFTEVANVWCGVLECSMKYMLVFFPCH